MKRLVSFIDAVLPPRCVLSGERVDAHGTLAPSVWAQLSFISAPFCGCCGFPFEFQLAAGEEAVCAGCRASPPPFDAARAALAYNDTARDLILGFKHGDKIHAAVPMVPWLRNAGAEFWGQADMIVPVPLHRWRLLRRRYNQSAVMAWHLSKAVDVPVLVDGLTRTRATPTQGHLRARARSENVRRAFAVPEKKQRAIAGKNIVLIDDVYTTGATISECTKALKKAGAGKVFVLTLAKVVRPQRVG